MFWQPTRIQLLPSQQNISGSLPPNSSSFVKSLTFNSMQGGLPEHPLSPLEAPTVCQRAQGAQGAQGALVKAFQESGSSEGGGEAEGGLALRNTARSRNSHGTGRAKHVMPTNKNKHYTKDKASGGSTEKKRKKTLWNSWGIKTVTGNLWCYCLRTVERQLKGFWTNQ